MAVRDFPDPVDSKNSRSELEPPILPSQTDSSCSGQAARLTGALVAFLMLAATLGILFEKNLVNTVTQQGWGRLLYGVSAALTQSRFGIGGFAIDDRIFVYLMRAGLSDNSRLLDVLGERFPNNLRNTELLDTALRQAAAIDLPPPTGLPDSKGHYSGLSGFSGDDSGIGTYAYLAFMIFGVHLSALTYLYFLITGGSIALYLLSQRRSTAAIVALAIVTTSLYLTVCADIVNFQSATGPGIDLKDPRFLGTIATIPVLHIIATWMRENNRLSVADYVILAAQCAILAFALHIRASVVWTVLAIPLLWMLRTGLFRHPGVSRRLYDWRSPRSIITFAVVLAVLLTGYVCARASQHPLYSAEGEIPRHTFWQGVVYSLQLNPAWEAKYGTLVNGAGGDAMPPAAARFAISQLPKDQQGQYFNTDGSLKRTALEKFTRAMFFRLLWNDPGFVLSTFLIVKPIRILDSEMALFGGIFAELPLWNMLIPIVAAIMLTWAGARDPDTPRQLLSFAGVALWMAIFASLPNWLVALNPLVMVDHFLWDLVFLGSIVIAASAALARLAPRKLRPIFTGA